MKSFKKNKKLLQQLVIVTNEEKISSLKKYEIFSNRRVRKRVREGSVYGRNF